MSKKTFKIIIGENSDFDYEMNNDGENIDHANLYDPRGFEDQFQHLSYAFNEAVRSDNQHARVAEKIADLIIDMDLDSGFGVDEEKELLFKHDFLVYYIKRLQVHKKDLKHILTNKDYFK